MCMQIESKVDIRKLVKTPGKGDLPLASVADKAAFDFAPSKVEDLNEILPKSGEQLATPQKSNKVSLCTHSEACIACPSGKARIRVGNCSFVVRYPFLL